MKFLYVEDDEGIRDLFILQIEKFFKVPVLAASNSEEAIAILKQESIDLILSDYMMQEGSGEDVYEFLKGQGKKTPFIFVTGRETNDFFESFLNEHEYSALIHKPIGIDNLRNTIQELIEKSSKSSELASQEVAAEVRDYQPIRINNFLRVSTVPCDIFLKLSDDKYVKVINANNFFTHSSIQKYIEKGVDYLFVKSEEFETLTDVLTKTLLRMFQIQENLNSAQKHEIVRLSHQTLHDQLKSIGINETTMNIANQTIETSLQLFSEMDELKDLIENMRQKNDYIYEHSLVTSYIAVMMAKNSSWNSEATTLKLSMAALMHDMFIDRQDLAMINHFGEDFDRLNKEDQKKILEHSDKAVEVVQRFKELPPDIDVIVAQHHEAPSGNGFPKSLSALRVSPLSAMFIIAHEFAHRIYVSRYDLDKRNEILEEFEKTYSKGNFKTPLKALLESFS